MSQIKTVTTTSGENEVVFDAFYAFVWFKNTGEGDVYVAPYSGFSAGDVDVSACPAGQMVRITARNEKVYILGASTLEIHAQNFSDCPFKVRGKGGEQITVTPLSVSENGTYTAPTGSAYSPVTVDVQEQPWEPLEDGYSNFWFELTDDTLSPWLNFSAKNADAVIDWGDGSGEVALDTLTPTHTYAKAGKYVVKVKGVTQITQQYSIPLNAYNAILTAVELSNEVSVLLSYAFAYQFALKNVVYSANLTTIGIYAFYSCSLLQSISPIYASQAPNYSFMNTFSLRALEFSNSVTALNTSILRNMYSIQSVTIPESVTAIGAYFANNCNSLSEIHMRPTTPPTLGLYSFSTVPNDYIIYVPVGTGDTYKAAAGWSAYSDHIVEEGQTLSKAALRRIQAAEKTIDESEVR